MTSDELRDGLPPGEVQPPPPSARLMSAVQQMQPVRTRSRLGAFAVVAAAALAVPGVVLAHHAMRPDLGALPRGWVIAAAALWAVSFGVALWTALVPSRGDVLPAPARASRAGLTAVVACWSSR